MNESMKKNRLKGGLVALLALFTTVCVGQTYGLSKYLHIPDAEAVDQQATFNGKPVDVSFHTNNDVVDKITVTFQDTTAKQAIVEYNQLIELFRKDKNYMDFNQNEALLEEEDIAQKIAQGKRYEAHFNYYDPNRNPPLMEALLDKVSDYFTEDQLTRLKELARKAADTPEDQKVAFRIKMIEEIRAMGLSLSKDGKPDAGKIFQFMATFMGGLKDLSDGDVWFKIQAFEKRFQIVLGYDAVK